MCRKNTQDPINPIKVQPVAGSSGSNVVRVAAAVSECLNTLCEADGKRTVMLLGTAALASDVPPLLRRCFTHELTAGMLFARSQNNANGEYIKTKDGIAAYLIL